MSASVPSEHTSLSDFPAPASHRATHSARHREDAVSAVTLEGKASVQLSREDDGGGEEATVLHLTQAESAPPWQIESLLAESWSTMGDVDAEDTESLDSRDSALQAGEENHFSNSDMVHLEREEVEMLEEDDVRKEEEEDDEEMQTSVLSVLSGDKELVEFREEEQESQAPQTEELLVSAEEPHVEKEPTQFRQVVPPMALPLLPILKLDPPSTTSTPVLSSTPSEAEQLYSGRGLHPPAILAPVTARPPGESLECLKFPQIPLSDPEEHSKSGSAPERLNPEPTVPETSKHLSSTELLCGGAALVAVVGVLAYGAVAFCRK